MITTTTTSTFTFTLLQWMNFIACSPFDIWINVVVVVVVVVVPTQANLSEDYLEFLKFLGQEIEIEGWDKWDGGVTTGNKQKHTL
jgi:hypothetical protein